MPGNWLLGSGRIARHHALVTIGTMSDVTHLIEAAQKGDRQAAAELLPLVYDELRKLAAAKMAAEKPGHTLNATALVHEAYLRLVGDRATFDGRGHFFAAAAEAMRRILIENARRKSRHKHGGQNQRVEFADVAAPTPDERLLALDEALDPAGGGRPGGRPGCGIASFRRPGSRADRRHARHHGLRSPAKVDLRPGLAPRCAGRLVFSTACPIFVALMGRAYRSRPMPIDSKRVQAIFLAAVEQADRAADPRPRMRR